MRTHDIAKILSALASFLRKHPNAELSALRFVRDGEYAEEVDIVRLVESLSRIDKAHLVTMIQEYNLPVDIRKRDSALDLLAKVSKTVRDDLWLKKRLSHVKKAGTPSTALLDAFRRILNEKKD